MIAATEVSPAVVAIAVALVPALVTYLVAAKKLSGKISRSDATDLWAESRSIRDWSADRINELNNTIASLEARVEGLENRNTELTAEKAALVASLAESTSRGVRMSEMVVEFRERAAVLESKLDDCRNHIEELEKKQP